MLAEGVSDRRGRVGAYLHRDRDRAACCARGAARGSRRSRRAARSPTTTTTPSCSGPRRRRSATIDEDFAIESSAGDIFQLGNTSWRIRRDRGGARARRGRAAASRRRSRSGSARRRRARSELSDEVSDAARRDRRAARRGRRRRRGRRAWLADETRDVAARGAADASRTSRPGARRSARCRARTCSIAERFFDEGGGMQLVLHAPLGGRINRAWGLALRKKFCVSFDFELQAAATDDGIVISLGQPHSFPLDTVFGFVPSHQARDDARAGAARSADVRDPLALERDALADRAAPQGRQAGAAAPHQDARGRHAVGRVPAGAGVRARTSPGRARFRITRSCSRRSATASSRRWTARACTALLERLERGEIAGARARHRRAEPAVARADQREPVRVPRRRAARGAPHARGAAAPRPARPSTVEGVGALDPTRSRSAAEEVAPTVRDATSCTTRCSRCGSCPRRMRRSRGDARGLVRRRSRRAGARAGCGGRSGATQRGVGRDRAARRGARGRSATDVECDADARDAGVVAACPSARSRSARSSARTSIIAGR